MKLDQETIVKHQFWFLLGGYFLVWLIAVLCLKFIAPGQIEDLKKAYEGAASGVNSAKSGAVNTATFLPPWEKETKEFSEHKGKIWKDAWDYQSFMYDWPEEWLKKYDMTNPQTQISADDRTEYGDKLYLNQIDYWRGLMPKMLNPVELKGGFDAVFKPMTKDDWKRTPTREEIWLAQEDLWVKRELLWDVLKAMTWQAQMPQVPIDEKKEPMPQGVEFRYRCKNKNWEITLNLRRNDKKALVIGHDSTIKNIHPSHHPQPLTSAKGRGIVFNVAQGNVRTMFEVRGEPVAWNDTKPFSDHDYSEPLPAINWTKIEDQPIYVSQGFDQTNSPIRRVNAIELAKQDCRTFTWPLQPNHILAQLDALPEDEAAKQAAASSSTGGGMPGSASGGPSGMSGGPSGGSPGMGMGSMGMGMGMPGMRGAAASGNKTPNNEIERDRYLQPKEQDKKLNPPSRHLPLALQLIVEQTHMHDVLVALANSRLRFQITQVEFRHIPDYTPQSDSDKKGGTDMAGGGDRTFSGGMPGMYGGTGSRMPTDMQRRQRQQSDYEAMMRRQMQQQQQRGMSTPTGGSGGMTSPPIGPSMSSPRGGRSGSSTPMPPAGSASDKSATTPQDDNLAELTIYGIATLYRSADEPQKTDQPGQPGSLPSPTAPQPAAAAPPAQPATQADQQPAVKTPSPPAGQQPASTATPAPSSPSNPPPKTNNPPSPGSNSPAPAPKQSDKPAEPPKTPPPAAPPAGSKK